MSKANLESIAPFFIVKQVQGSVRWYREVLGFDLVFATPEGAPFFAIVARDGVRIHLKEIHGDVPPLPNPSRHEQARWDSYIHVEEPETLAHEFEGRGATLRTPLRDWDDGLRGFEMEDHDGYVLFFGRPMR